jgi:hypothetical protein
VSVFPAGLPRPDIEGSQWTEGDNGTWVLTLATGRDSLIFHRHAWRIVPESDGNEHYRCSFVHTDGFPCSQVWSVWRGLPAEEWAYRHVHLEKPEPAEPNIFDQLDLAFTNYRYNNRLPADTSLDLVMRGGPERLAQLATKQGRLTVVPQQVVNWLAARGVSLHSVDIDMQAAADKEIEFLIYKTGSFIKEPYDLPDMRLDQRPHSRACGIRNHPHGPECSPDCPTCAIPMPQIQPTHPRKD